MAMEPTRAARQNKTRICIRIDPDLLARFQTAAAQSQRGYQTLINKALRRFIETEDAFQSITRQPPAREPKRMSHRHEIKLPSPRLPGRPRVSAPLADDE